MAGRAAVCMLIVLAVALPTAAAQDAPPAQPPEPPAQEAPRPGAQDSGVPQADAVVVTALRHDEKAFDVPASMSVVDEEQIRSGPDARSLPNVLGREPSVLLQKTGPGQSSPFIRGFTGFRTLLMMDGVRINNSVFREGPNQYWSTVDSFAIGSLELTRGPASVLWGSDAIGGAVNALTAAPEALDRWHGRWFVRYSTAERALFNRLEVEGGEQGAWALRAGITDRNFGNIRAGEGSGNLPGTGYEERDVDFRLDVPLESGADFTLVGQKVRQDDVPRTHTTIDAVPFHGTVPGTEIRRDLTQEHDLYYARLRWDGDGGLYDEARATLSWQRQEEVQERLRPGAKYDESGFEVHTLGTQVEFENQTSIGRLTWGLEDWRDSVDSFKNDFVNGALVLENIQGPVADDARYESFGVYVQDEVEHGPYDTVFGLRYSRAHADADRVDNPNVPGADPATPGNIIDVDESFSSLVGSLRTTRHVDEQTNVYAGLSQGFRAPNLSDLTAELTDSGIESPTPDLQPEYYTQVEIGARTERADWRGDVALYYTFIRDMIVQSPTGEVIGGVPVLAKDNVGDGFLYGVEARGERTFAPEWTGFAVASWQNGEVTQFTDAGEKVDKPTSRLMPFTTVLGVTWEPGESPWWWQADTMIQDKADRLSLKDETDTQRIPPGGTPGYGILSLRAGRAIGDDATLTVALENLLDKDYRLHGSGVNEPGRNLVLTCDVRF